MARIEPLAIDQAPPGVREVFADFQRARGNVPNMFRTMALVPAIATTAAAHMKAVLNSGSVELRLKELVVVRVSQVNACDY